jgi:phosphoglycolate phosphatase
VRDDPRALGGQSLMIGDRASDVLAGKYHGLKTIAVTYGYGTLSEMMESQADALCQDPSDLLNCIQGLINLISNFK